eukprot:1159026-Pelagomonas_calceolata.AAC.3
MAAAQMFGVSSHTRPQLLGASFPPACATDHPSRPGEGVRFPHALQVILSCECFFCPALCAADHPGVLECAFMGLLFRGHPGVFKNAPRVLTAGHAALQLLPASSCACCRSSWDHPEVRELWV